jgi:hypothetical protein
MSSPHEPRLLEIIARLERSPKAIEPSDVLMMPEYINEKRAFFSALMPNYFDNFSAFIGYLPTQLQKFPLQNPPFIITGGAAVSIATGIPLDTPDVDVDISPLVDPSLQGVPLYSEEYLNKIHPLYFEYANTIFEIIVSKLIVPPMLQDITEEEAKQDIEVKKQERGQLKGKLYISLIIGLDYSKFIEIEGKQKKVYVKHSKIVVVAKYHDYIERILEFKFPTEYNKILDPRSIQLGPNISSKSYLLAENLLVLKEKLRKLKEEEYNYNDIMKSLLQDQIDSVFEYLIRREKELRDAILLYKVRIQSHFYRIKSLLFPADVSFQHFYLAYLNILFVNSDNEIVINELREFPMTSDYAPLRDLYLQKFSVREPSEDYRPLILGTVKLKIAALNSENFKPQVQEKVEEPKPQVLELLTKSEPQVQELLTKSEVQEPEAQVQELLTKSEAEVLTKSEPDDDGWQIVPSRGSSPVLNEEKVQKQDLQTFIEDLVDDAEMFKQPIEVIKKSIETQQTKEIEMRKKKPEKQIEPQKIKFSYIYFEESLSESPANLKLDITNIMKENYGDAEVVIFNSFTPFPQLILKEKIEDPLPYHNKLETYLTFYAMNLIEDFLLKILLFRNTDDIGKDIDLLNKFIEVLYVYYFNCVPKEIKMQQLARFMQHKEEMKEIKKNKKLERWYINKTWNMIIDWVKNLFSIMFDVLDKIPKEAQEELNLKPTQYSILIKRIMDKIPEVPEEVTDQIRTVILYECNELLKEVEALSFLVTFFIMILQLVAKVGPTKEVAPPVIIFSFPHVFKKDIYDKIYDKLQENGIKPVSNFFLLTNEFLSNKPNFKKLISTKFAQKNQAMLLELFLMHSQEYWRKKKDLTKFCIFIEIYLDLEKPVILNDAKILTAILEELDAMDEINLPEIIKIQCEQAYNSAEEIRSAVKPSIIIPLAPFPEKSEIKVILQKSMANLEKEAQDAAAALLAEEEAEAKPKKGKGKGKGKRTRKLRIKA